MWCASRHRPFAIVEDPELREIMRMLYAKVQVPSRGSVARDIQLVMNETRARLVRRFEVRSANLCTDQLCSHKSFHVGTPQQDSPLL